MRKDELDVFDSLPSNRDASDTEHWDSIVSVRERRSPRWRGIALVLGVLVIAGLSILRWGPWNATPEPSAPAPAAEAEVSATPSPVSSSSSAALGDPDHVDGFGPQAVESRGEPSGSASIPAPRQPEVNTGNAESVMKAFLTAINARSSGDADDLKTVEDWTADYSALPSLVDLDPHQADGPMHDKAPTRATEVTLERVEGAKPADSKVSQTRDAVVRVESSDGTVTLQTWRILASLDDTTWKITEASLESWTGEVAE